MELYKGEWKLISELMDSIQRVYPGDQIVYKFADRYCVIFKRLESFDDNLSPLRRYRLIDLEEHALYALRDPASVLAKLIEFRVDLDSIRKVVEEQARETCMLVHLKFDGMHRHMDQGIIEQGKIQYDNVTRSFENTENKLEWLLEYSKKGAPAPSLKIVEDNEDE